MHKQFYSVRSFFISLLLSIGIGITVNGQTVEMYRENRTTLGNGNLAKAGDKMYYKITTANTTPSNITSSTIYGNIPAGTAYVAGSTKVNGVAVADVNGNMPFSSGGGLINSFTSGPGVLAPGTTAVIEYYVQVGANYGNFANDATLKATTGSGTITVMSNTVSTDITADPSCAIIFQSTLGGDGAFDYFRTLNTTNGTGITLIYGGSNAPCYNAITGAALANGSVLTNAQAAAYTSSSGRLYFINNITDENPSQDQDLCYVNTWGTVAAYQYVGYPLETNTADGYNIDRMAFCLNGYGYALTANAQDLIRFSIDPSTNLPMISRLGALINDVNNGNNNVLAEAGGDMFGDATGRMFLIPNSGKLYMINSDTRIATYLGTISGMPATGVKSVAADQPGNIYIGGSYTNVYKVSLASMSVTKINSTSINVSSTADYASCALPILAPVLNVTKTYANTSGADHVRAGDVIEYTIEVTNTGNINAALVKLSDAIPANSSYVAGSTTMNGVAVTDIGGAMPFSVTGGQYINSSSESTGIVKVGSAKKVVIKFKATTAEYTTICNQSIVTVPDGLGNTRYVYSDDAAQGGPQDATCFYSAEPLISMKATKTYIDNNTTNIGVVAGDPIDYVIEATNTGILNATVVKLYDAIPTYSHYVANSTTMNGVAIADIGGVMPFAVSGGTLINTSMQSAGVVAPGDANKVVIKFRVTTDALKYVCNQATISYTDANSATKNVYTDDPAQSGIQDATCFYSDGALGGGRVAVNTTVNEKQPRTVQPDLSTSVQVRPNPFIKDLNLQIELLTAETIQVRLIDFYGRTVYTTSRNVGAGVSSLNLPIPAGLSRGIYVLEVLAGKNRLLNKKLIKQ